MTGSLEDLFARAVSAYQAKDWEQAKVICDAILQEAPGHVGGLYLRGVIDYSLGSFDQAELFIRQALTLNPGFADIHYSLAQTLAAQEKSVEAIAAYQQALCLKPLHADAYYGLGKAFKVLKQLPQAIGAYKQAIAVKPDYPEVFNSLGILYYEQNNLAEATDSFERALALRPDFPEVLNNLAAAHSEAQAFEKAIACCRQAIALRPDYAAAFNNLGNALRAQERWPEARRCYERTVQLAPDMTEARNNLGLVFLDGYADLDAAAACFRHILERNPDHAPALTHLGIVFCHRGAFDEGLACYEKALVLQPGYRGALNNLGNALKSLGRMPEAIEAHRQAVAAKPADAEGHNNLAMSLLAAGHFEEGWRDYEWRWQTKHLAPARRDFTQPQWRGEEAAGCVLLIHAEQGFGDTLQFCRYAPLAAARGVKVILEVQPELARLMESLPGVAAIIARGAPLPDFDMHCPMLSLPLAFGTRLETIPASVPYLAPPDEALAALAGMINKNPQRLRVGLSWAGNPRLFSSDLAAANRRRSIAPGLLAPLAKLDGIDFYSLQKDDPQASADLHLVDLMASCRDFADTAALISTLDLVISVDTAVAHLAAALGKPVWLLNRYDSCWRWLQDRQDSPWYPTMRLFRQPRSGDWASVVAFVEKELASRSRNQM